MKVLCKKNIKKFKKGQWYDAIIQDLIFSKPKYTNKIEAGYSNYEVRQVYLISMDNSSEYLFYLEKSKYSKLGENIFSTYFYTKQEMRKEKLKKLNK